MPTRALTVALLTVVSVLAAGIAGADTWIVRTDLWGNPAFSTLSIESRGTQVHGDLDGDRIEGRADGSRLALTATDREARISQYVLHLHGDELEGTTEAADASNPDVRVTHAVTGWRLPERRGGARTFEFTPTDYSNTWNPDRRPVLVVWPGDTIHTTTVDSGGVDEAGRTRALFGNPQTGPFFIAGARPGDTLTVRIQRLKLNRDWADSLDSIVGRALGAALVSDAAGLGKPVRWLLDRESGRARPAEAAGALSGYSVPVKPMLGGLAVAPGFGMPAVSTGDTGRFGGNMDFNEVVEGNVVYLPVQQPGALLYFGDGHALQGDGETTQYALETSMDVTVTVDLVRGRAVAMPRVESPAQIMVLGQAGSLDEALKSASTGMVQWLQQDYGLTLSQAAQVLGTAVHFSVANLAGRSVGVAAKIDKALLPPRQ